MLATGELRWVKIEKPDTKFGEKYMVDLYMDKKEEKRIAALGVKIKKNNDGETYARFVRDVYWTSGDPKDKPKVYLSDGTPYDKPVGNGSKAKVQFQIIEGTNKYGKYKKFDLQAVMVTDLIPYGSKDGDEFEFEKKEEKGEREENQFQFGNTGDDTPPY